MHTITNSNVKLGTQFIAVDINVIANSNVKLAIALYCNGYKVQLGITIHIVHYNTITIIVLEIVITIQINIIANSIFQFDVVLYAKKYNTIQ